MSAEPIERLQELFEAALDLPEAKRESFLERECADEPELVSRVRALLAAAERGTQVIEAAIGEAAAATRTVAPGKRVGPYRLVRELGRGGMGAVYLAERTDPEFEQLVALKVVGAGTLNPKIVERFLAERQILAGLDHPHIARLLDGGRTDDGLPYFALEYVEGVPIDQYCDGHRLSTRERLALFRKVCGAVEFAHRKLVVHRDLKPSNILVTEAGEPKLLDFGIAKLLEPDAAGATLTMVGERAMTPEYASPEQVRGEPVSTATDVYALGLLLYELLSGRRAYRVTSAHPSDIERAVCDVIPERPSTAVTTDESRTGPDGSEPGTATPESISRARRTVPARLKKRLAGDLDNIVLMALRKEPERRYASVEQFSEDVRRHLEGLPVLAHADSFSYRSKKFARRNAVALGSALAVVGLIAALVTFYTMRLATERDLAQLEAETAEQVSGFLVDLFKISDPGESRGDEVTAREVLDSGATRVEETLHDQPILQARMRHTIGKVYRALGLYSEAERHLEAAAGARETLLGQAHPEALRSRNMLGVVYWNQGRYADAEAASRRAYDGAVEALGPEDPETLEFRNNVGLAVWRQGRFEEAERIHREILAARRDAGTRDSNLVGSLNNLAGVYWMQGRLEDAARMYQEALDAGREIQGDDHPGTLDALNNLAMTYDRLGRLEESRPLMERVVALRSRVLGQDHPKTLASLHNLGLLEMRSGNLSEAERLFRDALAGRERLLGAQHPRTLYSLRNLAEALRFQERPEEAESHHRRVLEGRLEALGEHHVDTLESFRDLGVTLRDRGRPREAETYFRSGLDAIEEQQGEAPVIKVELEIDLADLLLEGGRAVEAQPLVVEALASLDEQGIQDDELAGYAFEVYGRCLVALGRPLEAQEALEKSIDLLAPSSVR